MVKSASVTFFLRALLTMALVATATTASALSALFYIDRIYSNADGRLQFIVVRDGGRTDCDSGEAAWKGQMLISGGKAPATPQTFVFPADLPTCKTSQRSILIATQGFADLGIVTPDFIIPNGFLPIPDGSIQLANVEIFSYAALPNDGVTALNKTGAPVPNLATNLAGASASVTAAQAAPAGPALVTLVEFYNSTLDHYFLTHVANEIALLDAGTTIKGWARTGQMFAAYGGAQAGTSPVCRVYIPPGKGDSHFYGRGTAECTATAAANPSFITEDPQFFHVALPAVGVCPQGTIPVYRVFSNRIDANHRYMISRELRDQMTAALWLAEGDGPDLVVMCSPQ